MAPGASANKSGVVTKIGIPCLFKNGIALRFSLDRLRNFIKSSPPFLNGEYGLEAICRSTSRISLP